MLLVGVCQNGIPWSRAAIFCNTNQKLVVGNTVKYFVEIQINYITGIIAVETIVDSGQKQE